MKLFHLPIEPYKTRYTADWIQQFESEFDNNGIEFETIIGETFSDNVTTGGVLDACGTHVFKFTQLTKLLNKINSGEVKDGDVIFFADLWFPGLECLFYIRNMLQIKFKICGVFHAGTYDFHDFTYRNNMREWGKYLEASWFSAIDYIFVATNFHKTLLLSNSIHSDVLSNKIFVTGIPFYAEELKNKYPVTVKENLLVFPHRLDEEKHPELFDRLCDELLKRNISFVPVKTIVETSSRDEYFKLLAKSKVMVSFAEQETFGYSTLESMALDNIVVVPNKLSYLETVDSEYRYNDISEVVDRVISALVNYKQPKYSTINKWKNSVCNMLDIIRGDYGI